MGSHPSNGHLRKFILWLGSETFFIFCPWMRPRNNLVSTSVNKYLLLLLPAMLVLVMEKPERRHQHKQLSLETVNEQHLYSTHSKHCSLTFTHFHAHSYTDGGRCHIQRQPTYQGPIQGLAFCPRTN